MFCAQLDFGTDISHIHTRVYNSLKENPKLKKHSDIWWWAMICTCWHIWQTFWLISNVMDLRIKEITFHMLLYLTIAVTSWIWRLYGVISPFSIDFTPVEGVWVWYYAF